MKIKLIQYIIIITCFLQGLVGGMGDLTWGRAMAKGAVASQKGCCMSLPPSGSCPENWGIQYSAEGSCANWAYAVPFCMHKTCS
jgi:hypothetical protein